MPKPAQRRLLFRMCHDNCSSFGIVRHSHVIYGSGIIGDIQTTCRNGLSILVIFYFHFGDTAKQDARNLLSSIFVHPCHRSDKFSQDLLPIPSTHGDGSREPSIDTLLECMKKMLVLQGQGTLYFVLDALD